MTVALLRGAESAFVKMETLVESNTFVLGQRVHDTVQHEVIFHVKQRNMNRLKDIVTERSSPNHESYQKWLSFAEVASLTANIAGADILVAWLELNDIEVGNMQYI